MRTSLIETEQIEAHLAQSLSAADALLFEAKLLLDHELADKVRWQRSAYDLVKRYGREQLKKEIAAVHQSLFGDARHRSFSSKVRQIFLRR